MTEPSAEARVAVARSMHRVYNDAEDGQAQRDYGEHAHETWEELAPGDHERWLAVADWHLHALADTDVELGWAHEAMELTDRALAEKDAALAETRRIVALQQAALQVWKDAHPHEQSPGACGRALGAKNAVVAELVSELGKHAAAYHVTYHNWALFESCQEVTCSRVRALLAQAPKGVK